MPEGGSLPKQVPLVRRSPASETEVRGQDARTDFPRCPGLFRVPPPFFAQLFPVSPPVLEISGAFRAQVAVNGAEAICPRDLASMKIQAKVVKSSTGIRIIERTGFRVARVAEPLSGLALLFSPWGVPVNV